MNSGFILLLMVFFSVAAFSVGFWSHSPQEKTCVSTQFLGKEIAFKSNTIGFLAGADLLNDTNAG